MFCKVAWVTICLEQEENKQKGDTQIVEEVELHVSEKEVKPWK